jgi:hypothetical protein
MIDKPIPLRALAQSLRPVAQAALLTCVSAAAWAQNQAMLPAGTLEFVQGTVLVRSAAGASRVGQRGVVVNNGETIETQNGRAQMRMVDGAFISLQNDTTLRLDNYRVASATEPEAGFMNLVRGGLRTVTGLIGRSAKQNYRLQTATATVGIRGTGFSATSGDDGTRVRVSEGAIALCTQGGCLDLAAQQTGFAPNANTLPIRIAAAPVLQPAPSPSVIVVAPHRSDREIEPNKLAMTAESPLPSPSTNVPLTNPPTGMGAAYLVQQTRAFTGGLLGGTLQFDSDQRLINFVDGNPTMGSTFSTISSKVAEAGSDGIVAWGRWTGGSQAPNVNPGPLNALTHLSYFTGAPGAAVPISGVYDVFASTAPVALDLSGGVAFAGQVNSVTGRMTLNFPGASGGSLSYDLKIPINGQTFDLTGSALQFGATTFLGASSSISSDGAGCANGCVGLIPFGDAIQGSVYGAGNTRIGALYGFSSTLGKVTGSVVLKPGSGGF